ncbi:helix-turn-helix transcriptional regulator [Allosediminivita pacifica]|uniref:AraC-like DNA-binding protein n=1 Tax=Allosediminivita pacifica TaxID=1267769 RepID=A0A2T6ABR4_9RHOB|nr:AraC family transcriptional regulator [Allosediminivita pacifica]PTX41212.1 AraC-like DNA-binding protein [Allosediminivita pacifica]
MPRSDAPRFDAIDALFGQIGEVYNSMGSERTSLLTALSHAVMLSLIEELRRFTGTDTNPASDQLNRHEQQAQAFCELVEAHFGEAKSIPDYARALAVSPPHLTRICKRILGTSPNELVRKRRMLEATRLLTYTRLSVQDVALRSGFSDVTYFSRTFRAETGTTPSAFRQARDN